MIPSRIIVDLNVFFYENRFSGFKQSKYISINWVSYQLLMTGEVQTQLYCQCTAQRHLIKQGKELTFLAKLGP